MRDEEPGADRKAEGDERIVARAASQLEALLAQGAAPGLHIVATPIGNLGDIGLRALAVLARADIVLCEDTRRARKLLTHFGIDRRLKVYEEHSAARTRPQILQWLQAGQSVALISDAGTPLISDPGFKLVHEAIAVGIPVRTVPGPVAAVAGLSVSGLATDRFLFEGFLPSKATARLRRLQELAAIDATLVLYESPNRLHAVLQDVAEVLGTRDVVIVREMTKRFETHYRGTAQALLETLEGRELKGEIVLMISPPRHAEVDDALIVQQLDERMQWMTPRDAVDAVADMLKIQRKHVYRLMISRQKDK